MQPTIDLTQLRDIHLPVQPAFWPPAIGWWFVALGVCVVLGIGAAIWYRHRFGSKGYAKRLLKKRYDANLEPSRFALEISLLFKRIALIRFPNDGVATLTDSAWAQFIRRVGGNSVSEKMARAIAFAAYAPPTKTVDFSNELLYKSANKWIDTVFKRKKNDRRN